MKNKFLMLIMITLSSLHNSPASFNITIPKDLVTANATLLLYMLDGQGNQSVGKFHLDQHSLSRVILQHELEMPSSVEEAALVKQGMILLPEDTVADSAVVVCFELDCAVQIVRILVVKDCLLDVDPFDVMFVPFDALEMDQLYNDMEFDELSSLTEVLNDENTQAIRHKNISESWLNEYVAYAKLFVLLGYGKAQRAVRSVSTWWN